MALGRTTVLTISALLAGSVQATAAGVVATGAPLSRTFAAPGGTVAARQVASVASPHVAIPHAAPSGKAGLLGAARGKGKHSAKREMRRLARRLRRMTQGGGQGDGLQHPPGAD